MTKDQLVQLIEREGVERVGNAAADTAKGFVAGMTEGWDLTNWRAKSTGGAVLFYQIEMQQDGWYITDDPRVLVVNAPASEHEKWEATVKNSDAPVTILYAPGGKISPTSKESARVE